MSLQLVRYSDRPELRDKSHDLFEDVWPEYNQHGEIVGEYWPSLHTDFPEFQFVLYDPEHEEVVAEGHTIPCSWDGSIEGLPSGIDGLMVDAFALNRDGGRPNTLSALAVEIPPRNQARRLSTTVLEGMRGIAQECGFTHLMVPLRPSWKERYPLVPIERYVRWARDDGLPFDPWIRTHLRMGAEILKPEPQSMIITGRVSEWEEWTEMAFPESGDYVFPRGLAPVTIDIEADKGTYWEPNVWIAHRVPAA